jgi:hypothetical protein
VWPGRSIPSETSAIRDKQVTAKDLCAERLALAVLVYLGILEGIFPRCFLPPGQPAGGTILKRSDHPTLAFDDALWNPL